MKRLFGGLMGALFLAASIAFALIWFDRRALPYNEEGRYFDPQIGITYAEQSVAVYGLLAITSALVGALVLVASLRK